MEGSLLGMDDEEAAVGSLVLLEVGMEEDGNDIGVVGKLDGSIDGRSLGLIDGYIEGYVEGVEVGMLVLGRSVGLNDVGFKDGGAFVGVILGTAFGRVVDGADG